MFDLRVATKYDVRYSNGISADQECFNDMLFQIHDSCGGHIPPWSDCEEIAYSQEMEFTKDDWKKMIEYCEKLNHNHILYSDDEGTRMTSVEVAKIMEDLLKQSDPNNDFIRLCWL